MKTSIRHIIYKCLAVMFTIVLSAFVYKRVYWVPELKDQGYMLYNVMELEQKNDLLFLSESSNYWIHDSDKDRRTISEMINSQLNGVSLGGTQAPAYHAGMFLPIIRRIDDNSKVRGVVVTMNLRSFGQPWIYSDQENYLLRAKCFYYRSHPLYNRLAASLQFYENPSPEEQVRKMIHCFKYDTLKVDFPLPYNTIKTWCDQEKFPLPGGGEDYPKRVLADHYIKAYAFQIDTAKNPRIRDFDEIVRVCKEKNLKLYFNIISENVQWADSLAGKELVYFMRANTDLLVQRYTRMGVIVINNLEAVPAGNFGEKNWTTEHYDQHGRMIIAKNVAKAIMNNR